MNYSNLELLEMQIRRTQDWRRSVPNPSAETLAAWRLDDARNEIMRRYYARQEADVEETPHFSFTSDVKLK